MTGRHRRTIVALVAAIVLAAPTPGAARGRHDLHLTQTRLIVDGATVAARVRLFEDDLLRALSATATPGTPVVISDATVAAYLAPRLGIRADGVLLRAVVAASGEETDAQNQRVRWYLLTYQATRAISALGVRMTTFCELYEDQQNIVVAVRGTNGARHSLLFSTQAQDEQRVHF
ncbi:MAG: hypothetical protein MUE41_12740 [Gemmatimonadaceae bacterium]|nr:hypothetical protein [Gemmatimonadaceae bacterium]